MREVIDYVFCAICMVCPGSVVSWNHQDCNRQSMQRVQNTCSVGISVFRRSNTNVAFQTAISLFWSYEIRKGGQVLTTKPAIAFPDFVYIIVTLSYVFASNCFLNRLNCDCCFFANFLRIRALLVKD